METKASERAEQADPGDENVFCCPECKSSRVLAQMWVDANTEEVLDDTGRYYWCNNCEANSEDGELKSLDVVCRRETLEWHQEHGESAGGDAKPDDRSGETAERTAFMPSYDSVIEQLEEWAKLLRSAAPTAMDQGIASGLEELAASIRYAARSLPEIIIVVEGGLVQDVCNIPAGHTVVIRDFDVEGSDEQQMNELDRDDNDEPYYRQEWCG